MREKERERPRLLPPKLARTREREKRTCGCLSVQEYGSASLPALMFYWPLLLLFALLLFVRSIISNFSLIFCESYTQRTDVTFKHIERKKAQNNTVVSGICKSGTRTRAQDGIKKEKQREKTPLWFLLCVRFPFSNCGGRKKTRGDTHRKRRNHNRTNKARTESKKKNKSKTSKYKSGMMLLCQTGKGE